MCELYKNVAKVLISGSNTVMSQPMTGKEVMTRNGNLTLKPITSRAPKLLNKILCNAVSCCYEKVKPFSVNVLNPKRTDCYTLYVSSFGNIRPLPFKLYSISYRCCYRFLMVVSAFDVSLKVICGHRIPISC